MALGLGLLLALGTLVGPWTGTLVGPWARRPRNTTAHASLRCMQTLLRCLAELSRPLRRVYSSACRPYQSTMRTDWVCCAWLTPLTYWAFTSLCRPHQSIVQGFHESMQTISECRAVTCRRLSDDPACREGCAPLRLFQLEARPSRSRSVHRALFRPRTGHPYR